MTHLSDEQIAKHALCHAKPIGQIAQVLGLTADDIDVYGKYKAKINPQLALDKPAKNGKLILVSAINPTPAGEGKTTVTIGLADALNQLLTPQGKTVAIALREPSLGPVFGVKGGAAGGGYAQVLPMEDINLHFTGDFHAISAANNLLAAMIDNHIYQGNGLGIHPKKVLWRRVVDMNDRPLRHIIDGLGKATDGVMRHDGFDITVASEVMAIFCLANSLDDLKNRLGNILVAYRFDGTPVFAKDLKAHGAMTALLKDAFAPNLVQTIEGTPALVHGGPFANIAHGCNSLIATQLAQHLADYVVTEAGFGADLGAEKFCDIKCRIGNLKPDVCVIVATIKALKYNGGMDKANLKTPDIHALKQGLPNLLKHIENMQHVFGLNVVVALNRFDSDSEEELALVKQVCDECGVHVALTEVWGKGSQGGLDLAKQVLQVKPQTQFRFAYHTNDTIAAKIHAIATKIYGATQIEFSSEALTDIKRLEKLGFAHLPICMAKTQYSLSDNPKLLGRPTEFHLNVRQISVSSGAGFLVVMCGDILKMPGLPKKAAAEQIDVIDGNIVGLF